MEKNVEQFMEALEASTKYEEGAADLIHKAGTAIKNFFGTSTGAAQRAAQDAQRNAQTQATQQKADEINAQNMSSVDLATKINQVITDALKVANKGLKNALKIANKGLKNAQVEGTSENATESSEQNNDSKPVESTDENTTKKNDGEVVVGDQQEIKESLTRFLSALYEADASKNQEYYQTAIKNLQDIQNLIKPFLQGQKEFDKKTLKTISDKINDQSIQGVLDKDDKKALKAIQGINTAINGKIKVLQNNNKQQQTQSNSGDNTQQTQTGNTQSGSNTHADMGNAETTPDAGATTPGTDSTDVETTPDAGASATSTTVTPEEVKREPEVQQTSKEYKELDNAISNLMKYYDKSKSIRTLVNAWKTFKSMNSNGGADKILQ